VAINDVKQIMYNSVCTIMYNTKTPAKHFITYREIENVDVNINFKRYFLQQFNEL